MIKWQSDESVNNCNGCNTPFTLFWRKHHCRLCGLIFCNDCLTNKFINKYTSTIYKVPINTHMICRNCEKNIKNTKEIYITLSVFKRLNLDIKELMSIATVCKKWRKCSKIILNDFFNIQYKSILNKYEQNLLFINLRYISNHNNYIYKINQITNLDENIILDVIRSEKSVSCKTLRCKYCSRLNKHNVLPLLVNSNLKINKYILRILNSNINIYYPFIISSLKYYSKFNINNNAIIQIMKNTIKLKPNLTNYIIWELELNSLSRDYYDLFKTIRNNVIIDLHLKDKMKIQYELINILTHIINNTSANLSNINTFLNQNKVTCLLETNLLLNKLINIDIKNSNSKPSLLTFQTPKKTKVILLKNEDMRIDNIIIKIINFTKKILSRFIAESYIVTYNILPIKNNYGLIEIVKDSITLLELNNTNFSIQNYIFENNKNISIEELRTNFINSCSFYSILSYLLGIGDRHLDNIMINTKGLLFHIDFTYIMGDDPKKTIAPEIRITPDMIDAMGGINSVYYKQFCKKCKECFKELKLYKNNFKHMLYELINFDSKKFTKKFIDDFIDTKMYIDIDSDRADLLFNIKLNDNSSSKNYQLIDSFHKYGKYSDKYYNNLLEAQHIIKKNVNYYIFK